MKKGFTLIELLIVVAIIAILAAIAVPNFLEAQVRAKVSRALADMRSVNTAFETYRIDYNNVPPHGIYNRTANGQGLIQLSSGMQVLDPILLTTPVQYLSGEAATWDVFQLHLKKDVPKTDYYNWVLGRLNYTCYTLHNQAPLTKALGAQRYGGWRMLGAGPDQAVFNMNLPPEGTVQSRTIASKILPYDSTNGTVSAGDIIRTGKGEQRESWL